MNYLFEEDWRYGCSPPPLASSSSSSSSSTSSCLFSCSVVVVLLLLVFGFHVGVRVFVMIEKQVFCGQHF